jgi:hypothetical protein
VDGKDDFRLGALEAVALEHALAVGLGAWAAYVSRCAPDDDLPPDLMAKVRGAALAARILSDTMLEALEDVLAAANAAGCVPLLLKGAANASRYYPRPELRTMGDLDLLVPQVQRGIVEDELRRLGYVQRSELAESFYAGHQHSMPFWHPSRQVWVEVHTRLTHSRHVLARADVFDADTVLSRGLATDFRGRLALVMPPELGLAYLCARWIEAFDAERGIWPLLDAALLSRGEANFLNWGVVIEMAAREPLLATAMNLALGYLSRVGLIALPVVVLADLSRHDRVTNRATRAILWGMVDAHIIAGQSPGRFATAFNLSLAWSTLLAPRPALRNLCALPVRLVFPPDHSLSLSVDRLMRGLRGRGKSDRGSL